ncbi:hypothetical protein [Pseudoalteromonas sp. Of11M-6]|uniref:hypothetical protein n=1 Tax=Pseudoalteromonas sp. Of11M-6 TaxID=2917754 RepID=UPI001EF5D5C5|nr:hypothetical protein [Pseudoalteromonas sp. Of11M-6]MCG7556074.1 hypothetical protein [Pseudoalteromonas sp. Of11M-6]
MAYTLRTSEEDEKILKKLREATDEQVTTKAIIKGATMLANLIDEHKKTLKKLEKVESDFAKLKELSHNYLMAKNQFESYFNNGA